MPAEHYEIDHIKGNELTPEQRDFIDHWCHHFFGAVAVTKGLAKAPVHWRLLLREQDEFRSHVAITEMVIEIDGVRWPVGAIGGLFTPPDLQKRGWANALMDEAEAFILGRLKKSMAILFCLEELVPFYARRNWERMIQPVTLQQRDGVVAWRAEFMLLSPDRTIGSDCTIHLPNQTR